MKGSARAVDVVVVVIVVVHTEKDVLVSEIVSLIMMGLGVFGGGLMVDVDVCVVVTV